MLYTADCINMLGNMYGLFYKCYFLFSNLAIYVLYQAIEAYYICPRTMYVIDITQ